MRNWVATKAWPLPWLRSYTIHHEVAARITYRDVGNDKVLSIVGFNMSGKYKKTLFGEPIALLLLLLSLLPFISSLNAVASLKTSGNWQLGPFTRIDKANPIITSSSKSSFYCPILCNDIHWEAEHVFNPAAVVREGKVYLIYRAEDDYGIGIGMHTSRLGLAISHDGIQFKRSASPIFIPDWDDQLEYEFPGGCEDPRIVETEEGLYVMTYTQWNRQIAVLGIATSSNLLQWNKHGYAFQDTMMKIWSKSGSIVCRQEGDRLIATKIEGKYWMYWGDIFIHAATSDNLISWEPLLDERKNPLVILEPRIGKFDSVLVEPGPPALITEKGILLLYNGKNLSEGGDPDIQPNAYSAGQVLFDALDPTRVISRCKKHFLSPKRNFEMKGQYQGGTVFVQGLVHFQNKWLLYYGAADTSIGVAALDLNLAP